jgi:thiamine-phosphate pyrophosphorylase
LPPAHNQPIVCYVTDRKALGDRDAGVTMIERIGAAIAARADWVQLREKDMRAHELLALARRAVGIPSAARGAGRIIANDRLDVALAAGASGVHLGGESMSARDVIRWCRAGNAPKGFLVGVSCHSLEDARRAEDARADYIFFGPVFDTPLKRSFGTPQGTERLAEICRAIRLPVVAIGGITQENAPDCVRAGAAGIAAIRLFQEARTIGEMKEIVARLHASA